jgi:RNA polymerase sigma factor (sigma-70 family)
MHDGTSVSDPVTACYHARQMDDLELLGRWRAGDSKSGHELMLRYFGIVRSYFMTKAPREYEELVSKTFLRLVEKRDKCEGSFRGFVFGVARMILMEHFRVLRRDASFDPFHSSAIDLGGDRVSSIIGKREHQRLLFEALRSLLLEDQELLELYYFQELSGREVAELLDVGEPMVRFRLRRALTRLGQGYRALEETPHEREYEEGTIEAWMKQLRAELDDLNPE